MRAAPLPLGVGRGDAAPPPFPPPGYGGISYNDSVIIPGFSHAIVFDWRGDNAGPPQSVAEVAGDYKAVQTVFPGAAVFASTLDNFTQLLTPAVLATLPVVTSEIGDTWMHGAASDPQKTEMYKRAAALRRACLDAGACSLDDPVLANFTRFLLKNNEHTWGKSQPTYFSDYANWSNEQLQAQLAARNPRYLDMIASWQEQRDWGLTYALEALRVGGSPLAASVAAAWADVYPDPNPPPPAQDGWAPATPGRAYSVGRWSVAFDAASGAVTSLSDAVTGQAWASPGAGSFLGRLQYDTYDNASIGVYLQEYASQWPPMPNYPKVRPRPGLSAPLLLDAPFPPPSSSVGVRQVQLLRGVA